MLYTLFIINMITLILGYIMYVLYNREILINKKLQDDNTKLQSQKKSSEVLTGHIAEKCAPFLEYFKYNPRNAQFLGQPIDYIVFGEEKIIFLEVKSGNAKLSAKQKKIKDLVQRGLVEWDEMRIK